LTGCGATRTQINANSELVLQSKCEFRASLFNDQEMCMLPVTHDPDAWSHNHARLSDTRTIRPAKINDQLLFWPFDLHIVTESHFWLAA